MWEKRILARQLGYNFFVKQRAANWVVIIKNQIDPYESVVQPHGITFQ
jgi:hypothetical protein